MKFRPRKNYFSFDCDDTDASFNTEDIDGDGLSTCQGDCDDTEPEIKKIRRYEDVDGDGEDFPKKFLGNNFSTGLADLEEDYNQINNTLLKDESVNILDVKVENPTSVVIYGIQKDLVGEFAAQIRSIRPPEPYKGKGVAYETEVIRRKAGKTGK